MIPNGTSLNRWQRSAGLAASVLLGLMLALVCGQAAAAQSPVAPAAEARPAGTVWFVNNQPGEGLAGNWRFEQVVNSTTVNSALLTNAATLSNGANISFTNLPPVSVPNLRKLTLNGTNQFLLVPDASQLDVAPAHFSLAVWARRTSTGSYDAIFDSGTETNKWWVFIASNNHFGIGVRDISEIYSNASITDNNWHHLAAVVNGTGANNLALYVDGSLDRQTTITDTLTPAGTKRIGVVRDTGGNLLAQYAGDLDELRLYNRSLSAAEVARLAQGRGCVADGLSWATALADLQCALDVAASGDEIWVAKSLTPYRPGTSEFARFNLVSGVGVFGNFNGNETSRSQRPPVHFELDFVTTLSGDLLDDDQTVGVADNARNVVQADATGPGTVFDGLRVEAGNNPELIAGGGGGLRLRSSGQLSVSNALFTRNQAAEAGGGLLASSGQISLDNVIFELNSAQVGGGAALSAASAINGGQFTANIATGDCGGLFINQAAVTVTGTLFEHNRASGVGGGACTSAPATFNGVIFDKNQALSGGGLNAAQALTVTNSQFTLNTTRDGGSALQASQALVVSGGLFASNTATGTLSLGGAISATGGLALSGARFEGNSAAAGGALAATGGTVLITSSVFLANRATLSNGGALRIDASGTNLTNLLLVGNQAANQGGAIYVNFSGISLGQLTAVSNTAAVSGSVLFADSSSTQLFNSLLWHNGPGALGRQGSGLAFVGFNLGDAGLSGTGNISDNPRFVREPNPGDGDWTTRGDNDYGDLHLTLASRAIDAGKNALLSPAPAGDLDGLARFVDIASVADTGVGTPPIVDMGAYEVQLQHLFLPLVRR